MQNLVKLNMDKPNYYFILTEHNSKQSLDIFIMNFI